MRLLNTASLELEDFADNDIPFYAILSHTWEKGEVLYGDMQSGNEKTKAGYAKVVSSCKKARQDKLAYLWIDTCCIDKSSSAELTEAINSMYRWYANASVCYAYLADVPAEEEVDGEGSSFARSRWFTRGWTLQELIASSPLKFYSRDWKEIGTKADLKEIVSEISGVDVEFLEGLHPKAASVAKRMSWASKRVTTRVEDITYCLMGLFGVNMPLLYGEGEKAFIRLQEEIMKIEDDHSLFAWKATDYTENDTDGRFRGLLAKSPACFVGARNIVGLRSRERRTPLSITNQGLCIELVLIPVLRQNVMQRFIAPLDCVDSKACGGPIGILMRCLSPLDGIEYARIDPHLTYDVTSVKRECKGLILPAKTLYVRQDPEAVFFQSRGFFPVYKFHVPLLVRQAGWYLSSAYPPNRWNDLDRILHLPAWTIGVAGIFLIRRLGEVLLFVVVVAVDCNFCVSVRIEDKYSLENWKSAYIESELLLEDDIRKRYSTFGLKENSVASFQGEVAPKEFTASYVSRSKVRLQGGFNASAVVTDLHTESERTFVVNITVEKELGVTLPKNSQMKKDESQKGKKKL